MKREASDTKSQILALIPARGGSVGVPGKNIRNFCGKPLIAYSIAAAQESGVFDRIIVSTDSPEIAEIARQHGAEVPFLRPAELATPTASGASVALHALDYLRDNEGYEPECFFVLQPTSPLRDADDIKKSLEIYYHSAAPGLVSVCETHHQTFNIVDGVLRTINAKETEHISRQDLAQTYKQDGSMLYINETKQFREHPAFDVEGMAAYVVPKWKAVDIDTLEDFELAEVLYKNRGEFTHV
jgi:CMP-N,N'-diacetyllegionaminic acid synthase